MSERISYRHVALASAWRAVRISRPVQAGIACGAAGTAAALVGLYFWLFEGRFADSVFAAAVTLAIGAGIVCLCRRILPAAVLILALMYVVRTVSFAKQQANEVLLHAYDVVTYLRSWSGWPDAWSEHRSVALGVVAVLLAATAAGLITFRLDRTRVPRAYAAAAVAVFAGVASAADTVRGERRHTEFYFENAYVTFFYASWSETLQALWRGQLIEAAPRLADARGFELPGSCTPAARPSHIILIHQESVVPPAYFPKLSYDRRLDSFFQSFDGKLNKLRVETFGGASWLTEFSVFTGLSVQSFGGMRQFVQQVMADRVGDTLPQALARCGYRNVMFYPMLRNFLGSGRFFETAGIHEIRDAKAQAAKLPNERDRFYYANAIAEIGHHVKASAKPLFVYIQTMATHGPYDYAYWPDVDVAGGGPGTHSEMNEYLRRLTMARMDYGFLRSELIRRFPYQQFLIMHYGDHQPTATRMLLGFDENASIEDVVASGNDAARLTYYALDTIGYRPPPLPSLRMLDVAYLSTILLEAAGMPLSDSYRERRRLMMLCHGRYHDCPLRDEVLRFHRRLIDSGLLKAL